MQRRVFLALGLVLCLASIAQAVPTIVVGTHVLLPNTPGQTITISVTGAEQVAGVNFNAQLGDGGPLAGGVDITPQFLANIIGPGSIFGANNTGQVDNAIGFGNSLAFLSTTTASGTVLDNGILAVLTVDTTGLSSGGWVLSMDVATLNGATNFATAAGPLDIAIQNGFVQIVPEPSSIVLGLFAVAGIGAVAIRKHRARQAA